MADKKLIVVKAEKVVATGKIKAGQVVAVAVDKSFVKTNGKKR